MTTVEDSSGTNNKVRSLCQSKIDDYIKADAQYKLARKEVDVCISRLRRAIVENLSELLQVDPLNISIYTSQPTPYELEMAITWSNNPSAGSFRWSIHLLEY